MSTDLRLQVLLSTVDKATKPLRDIMAGSKGMAQALGKAREQLKGLNETQRNVQAFRELRANIRANDAALKASAATTKALQDKMGGLRDAHGPLAGQVRTARNEIARIAAQMRDTAAPTAELNRDYALARDRLAQLEGQYNTSTNAIRRTREQVRIAGQNTGTLTIKQQRLSESLASAKAKLDAAGIGTDRLSAKNRELRASMAQATAAIDKQKAALAKLQVARAKLNATRETAGKLRGAGTGAAIAGGVATLPLVQGIRDALAFESAMADVKKVVDFDTPEQFQKMRRDIQDLSAAIPLAQADLASIVAAAGQSGIARKDLLAFARDAAQMGVAFDIAAGDAGETMAKFRTSFKLSQPEVVKLADKINFLGNTTAAGTGPITDIVRRIGALGDVAGLDSGAIAALGATVSSMGVESEVGATGIKNLMLTLTSGTAATKAQKKAFDALGLSSTDVAQAMQKDATGAIVDVLTRLRELPKAQQSATLTKLFGRESVGAIAPLLTNLDTLKENLGKVSDEAQFGGSMFKEFAARADTVGNVLELTKNAAQVTSTELGQALLPTVKDLSTSAIGVFQGITAWMRAHPTLTSAIVKTAAVLAVLVAVIGSLLIGVSAVIGPFALLRFSLVGIGVRMPTLLAMFRAMPGPLGLIRVVLTNLGRAALFLGRQVLPFLARSILIVGRALLLNPIGLAITAIAGAAFLIIKYWKPITAWASAVWGWVAAKATAAWSFIVDRARTLWGGLTAYFGGVFDIIAGIFTGNWQRVRDGSIAALGGIVTSITAIFGELPAKFVAWGGALIDGLIQGITAKAGAVKDAIVNTAGSIGGWFKEKLGINSPSTVFAGFGINTIEGLVQGLQSSKDGPLEAIGGIVQRMRQLGAGIALGASAATAVAQPAIEIVQALPPSAQPAAEALRATSAPRFDSRAPVASPAASPSAGAGAGAAPAITINVYGAPGMDTQALARAVRAEIEAYERSRQARARSRFGDK